MAPVAGESRVRRLTSEMQRPPVLTAADVDAAAARLAGAAVTTPLQPRERLSKATGWHV